jgi:NDP-sugar pyrophosphorylase family protein
MFTGVHILSPEAFDSMPESGCVIRSAYRTWVDRDASVLGIVDDSPWADLGTVSEYHRLNLALAEGRFTWPGVTPRGDCILPPGRKPEPRIRRSVIGKGAELAQGVELDRCVVWPEVRVERSGAGTVLTPQHRIEVD